MQVCIKRSHEHGVNTAVQSSLLKLNIRGGKQPAQDLAEVSAEASGWPVPLHNQRVTCKQGVSRPAGAAVVHLLLCAAQAEPCRA